MTFCFIRWPLWWKCVKKRVVYNKKHILLAVSAAAVKLWNLIIFFMFLFVDPCMCGKIKGRKNKMLICDFMPRHINKHKFPCHRNVFLWFSLCIAKTYMRIYGSSSGYVYCICATFHCFFVFPSKCYPPSPLKKYL